LSRNKNNGAFWGRSDITPILRLNPHVVVTAQFPKMLFSWSINPILKHVQGLHVTPRGCILCGYPTLYNIPPSRIRGIWRKKTVDLLLPCDRIIQFTRFKLFVSKRAAGPSWFWNIRHSAKSDDLPFRN
jgi:hypothetical protein